MKPFWCSMPVALYSVALWNILESPFRWCVLVAVLGIGVTIWKLRRRKANPVKSDEDAAAGGPYLIEYTLLMAFVAVAGASLFVGAGNSLKNIWQATNQKLADPTTELDRKLAEAVRGRVLFNPPDRMKVGQHYRVEVRISRSAAADIVSGLRGKGDVQIADVQVAPYMTVKLESERYPNGDRAFDIDSHGAPEDQFVSADTFTQWAYDVTPLVGGDPRLFLSVGIRVKLDKGSDEKRFYPLYEKQIHVEVTTGYRVQSFLAKYWQWLATGIVIPIVAAFVRVWWKRREKKQEKRDAPIVVTPDKDDLSRILTDVRKKE